MNSKENAADAIAANNAAVAVVRDQNRPSIKIATIPGVKTFDHLAQLRDCLTDTGELVLETLVVEGDENTVFVPPGRYARMGNVWCIPSPKALSKWLLKVGFKEVNIVDITVTTVEEQRQTSWMQFHSLSHFLDPNDPSKTIEGHPAPMRAILIAKL